MKEDIIRKPIYESCIEDFIVELREIEEEILEIGGRITSVCTEPYSEYDHTSGVIEIAFERPYTQDELTEIKRREDEDKEQRRVKYEELKKEFEG